jgi:cobalt-zinc-cadmium resistance protein CzcA
MLAVRMAAIGVYSYQKLPIDAVPDITNVQVQINTSASGYSPLEVEQRVTFPIETVMAGFLIWSRPARCRAMVCRR